MAIISRSCERARSWVSLDLDDELSELEGAMLRAHTARCVPCAQFQSETVAITHKLRLAPLEPLPAPDRPASAPPRRRAAAAGRCRRRRRGARGRDRGVALDVAASRASPRRSRRPPRLSSRSPISTRRRACRSIRRSRSGRASGSIRAAPTSNLWACARSLSSWSSERGDRRHDRVRRLSGARRRRRSASPSRARQPGGSTTSSAGCCCRATSATCAACAIRRRR